MYLIMPSSHEWFNVRLSDVNRESRDGSGYQSYVPIPLVPMARLEVAKE